LGWTARWEKEWAFIEGRKQDWTMIKLFWKKGRI